ncbi:C6 transcription factor [Pseudohyphozyma bogoriensis]|nr:C6 transcription factor [Pseudohyphozyma bogoriensis]
MIPSSYGLACEYEKSSGPAASKPVATRTAPPAYVPPPPPQAFTQDNVMAERLREISDRLRSIESSLENVHLSGSSRDGTHSHGDSPISVPSLVHHTSEAESTSSSHSTANDAGHLTTASSSSHPVNTVTETVDMLEQISRDKRSPVDPNDWLDARGPGLSSSASRLFAGIIVPDAIVRGIMSEAECAASFQIFFAKMAPWIPFFDQARDNDAVAMRERNPLLFHAILLSTAYYLMGSSERGSQVYYSLTALVNEILAPLVISALPSQVTLDFVRALILLLLYKPVQFAQLYAAGITDPEAAEQAAKLNTFSASLLGNLMIRTALSLGLPSITNTFAKNFSLTIAMPPQTLSDLRLWYWLCVVDTHSALTTGRAGIVDIGDALRTTRLFASLKAQETDVRLAATVEVYAIAKQAVTAMWVSGNRTLAAHDLRRFNKDMDDWEGYWDEPLRAAGEADPLAWTLHSVFCNFIRLSINASVFARWRTERKQSLSRDGDGRPDLSHEDWSFLKRAVDAGEKVLFSVCVEARRDGGLASRHVSWPPKGDGPRPALHLDPVVVDQHRTAFDTVVCVVYVYCAILLAKMANSGLIRCELNCLIDDYAKGLSLKAPQRLINGAKLGRLLELTASFLDAIAPTTSHPARKHAKMIRVIHAAGTMGQSAPVDPDKLSKEMVAQFTAAHSATSVPAYELPETTQEASELSIPGLDLPQPTEDAGQALASILGGLSPSWLNEIGYIGGGMDVGGSLDSQMAVDWDSLEKSMNLQQTQLPLFTPLGSGAGYFSLNHQA